MHIYDAQRETELDFKYGWVGCPACGNKKIKRIRRDTQARNLPLYCRKCKREYLVEITPDKTA